MRILKKYGYIVVFFEEYHSHNTNVHSQAEIIRQIKLNKSQGNVKESESRK
jgi:hypothetical protein